MSPKGHFNVKLMPFKAEGGGDLVGITSTKTRNKGLVASAISSS